MDPNANWDEQQYLKEEIKKGGAGALAVRDRAEQRARLRELQAALREWIARGGFPPDRRTWGPTKKQRVGNPKRPSGGKDGTRAMALLLAKASKGDSCQMDSLTDSEMQTARKGVQLYLLDGHTSNSAKYHSGPYSPTAGIYYSPTDLGRDFLKKWDAQARNARSSNPLDVATARSEALLRAVERLPDGVHMKILEPLRNAIHELHQAKKHRAAALRDLKKEHQALVRFVKGNWSSDEIAGVDWPETALAKKRSRKQNPVTTSIDFAELLMKLAKPLIGDRQLYIDAHTTNEKGENGPVSVFKLRSTDKALVNYVNLPKGVGGAGGGAEALNNRTMFRVTGFDRGGNVKVEQSITFYGFANLRVKTASPQKIAEYLAGYLGKLARTVEPKFSR